MLGNKNDNTRDLLGMLSDMLVDEKPRRSFSVESVVTAGEEAHTQSGLVYTPRAEYLLSTTAMLEESPCADGEVKLATVVATGSKTTYSLCNALGLDGSDSKLLNLAGTAAILSDHKRPLLLGVYGPDQSALGLKFTSIMAPLPNGTDLIVDSIVNKTRISGAVDSWIMLNPAKGIK